MRLWLKDIRESRGIESHEEASILCGISRSYFTHIENGTRTPTVDVAKNIGLNLGFPWTNFFEDDCSLKEQKIMETDESSKSDVQTSSA